MFITSILKSFFSISTPNDWIPKYSENKSENLIFLNALVSSGNIFEAIIAGGAASQQSGQYYKKTSDIVNTESAKDVITAGSPQKMAEKAMALIAKEITNIKNAGNDFIKGSLILMCMKIAPTINKHMV